MKDIVENWKHMLRRLLLHYDFPSISIHPVLHNPVLTFLNGCIDALVLWESM